MSDKTISESLGIEFVEPEDLQRSFPTVYSQKPSMPEEFVEDEDLNDDFEVARESLVGVLNATRQGCENLSQFIAGNPQELDMYEALSKMSSTTVSAATALINLHRIKKQVTAIALKSAPKAGDQTLIVEGDVVMAGTMGDILDRVKGA